MIDLLTVSVLSFLLGLVVSDPLHILTLQRAIKEFEKAKEENNRTLILLKEMEEMNNKNK